MAFKAIDCVDAETRRSLARWFRNVSTSPTDMVEG
jgi:hypothetical protein